MIWEAILLHLEGLLGMMATPFRSPRLSNSCAGSAAIVDVGIAIDTPDGLVAVVLRDALVCDHRVVSGADAARFLTALAGRLSDPAALQT
jgi:pyruvate/2-oxoglutarate dehydrogenase complex dihydrolipoamide acyltransferase (E2) component